MENPFDDLPAKETSAQDPFADIPSKQKEEPMGFRRGAATAGVMSLAQMPFNIASTVTGGRVGQKTAEFLEKELEKVRKEAPVGAAVGEIGSYFVPGIGAARGVSSLLGRAPKTLIGRVGESAAVGAAAAPAGFAEEGERASQIGSAAAIGGVLPVATKAVGAAAKTLTGAPTATKEAAARRAESLGFKVTPSQVRQDVPSATAGSLFTRSENQAIANRLASETTGAPAKEISENFISSRFNKLGQEFDKVYKGKTLIVDDEAITALQQMSRLQDALPQNAKVSPVKNTVDKILSEYNNMLIRSEMTGGKPLGNFGVQGDLLQKIRSDLLQVSRSIGQNSPVDRRQILDLVSVIDDSVARNNPAEAKILETIRPQYRNTVILHELQRRNGIQGGNISLESLGDMLQTQRYKTRRVATSGLDELGYLGRELGIRGRFQPDAIRAQQETTVMPSFLRQALAGGAGMAGLESQAMRGLQRSMAPSMVRGKTPEPLTQEQIRTLSGVLGTM